MGTEPSVDQGKKIWNETRVSERVELWMQTARWAASGGNAQPWRIAVLNGGRSIVLKISIDPEYRKAPSPMDIDGLASALAIGCLAQNFAFVAANDGFCMRIREFELSSSTWDSSVKLEFQRDSAVESRFTNDQIRSRKTDRTKLRRDPLNELFLANLRSIASRHVGLNFVEFANTVGSQKSRLLPYLANLEQIRWRNAKLLNGLLSEIGFDSKSEKSDAAKIPLKQLGLSLPDQWLLRFFRRFPSMQILFRFGFDVIPIYKAVHILGRHCDRICFLETKLLGDAGDFKRAFELGRCFQELWLEANKQGVALQPLGHPFIALAYWREDSTLELTEKQKRSIESVTSELQRHFDIDLKQLVLGFRIGYSNANTESSSRRDVFVERRADRF